MQIKNLHMCVLLLAKYVEKCAVPGSALNNVLRYYLFIYLNITCGLQRLATALRIFARTSHSDNSSIFAELFVAVC